MPSGISSEARMSTWTRTSSAGQELCHEPVERLRILKHQVVPAPWELHELGVRQPGAEPAAVLDGHDQVGVAVDDEGRELDPLDLDLLGVEAVARRGVGLDRLVWRGVLHPADEDFLEALRVPLGPAG